MATQTSLASVDKVSVTYNTLSNELTLTLAAFEIHQPDITNRLHLDQRRVRLN